MQPIYTFNDDRILRSKEVMKLVQLTKPTIQAMENEGRFPKHIQLGKRVIGWRYSDIMTWIKNKI